MMRILKHAHKKEETGSVSQMKMQIQCTTYNQIEMKNKLKLHALLIID